MWILLQLFGVIICFSILVLCMLNLFDFLCYDKLPAILAASSIDLLQFS